MNMIILSSMIYIYIYLYMIDIRMQRARLDAEITTASDLCAGTRVMDFLLSSLNFEFEAQDAFKMSRDNLPSQ